MTKPNVFIVESLKFADEEKSRCEGKVLYNLLKLSEKECKYYYIRTKKELKSVLRKFEISNYRYLHLSCHGNATALGLTLESVTFEELGKILRPMLKGKRIFLSACSTLNRNFVANVLAGTGCYSVVGPCKDIEFKDAAISFLSLYHMLFAINENAMKGSAIVECLAKIQLAFNIELDGYFWRGGRYLRKNKMTSDLTKIRETLTLMNFYKES